MEIVQATQNQEPVVAPVQPAPADLVSTQEPVVQDIVTRASAVKLEQPAQVKVEKDHTFDAKGIENVKTFEEAKQWAIDSHKSFEKGYQKKYRDVAAVRKEYEQLMNSSNTTKPWTPERLLEESKNPDFIKAVQDASARSAIVNEDEDTSLMSETEKAKLSSMENMVNKMYQEKTLMEKGRQDETLKGKYANYSGEVIDQLLNDVGAGKYRVTREDAHKVYDYDNAVKRAYQLGLQDKNTNVQEKISAASVDGYTSVAGTGKLEQMEGEKDEAYIVRNGLHRAAQLAQTQQVRT